jgi:hypothetical protein
VQYDSVIFQACKGQPQHEEVQLGLFFSILVDPKAAPRVGIIYPMIRVGHLPFT